MVAPEMTSSNCMEPSVSVVPECGNRVGCPFHPFRHHRALLINHIVASLQHSIGDDRYTGLGCNGYA